MRSFRLPVALLLAVVVAGAAAAATSHTPSQSQTPPNSAPSKSSAKDNEALHNAVAAVVVAALTEQFDNRTIAVQLDSVDVQIVSIRDRVVSGEGRMRIGADDEDWIGFRYRTLYDTLYGSAGYPELTLGGSGGERAVPNDSALVQELDARVVAALDKEFQGQPVRLQLDRINTLEAGKRFCARASASPISAAKQHTRARRRVYDRHENAWMRVNYELAPRLAAHDDAIAAAADVRHFLMVSSASHCLRRSFAIVSSLPGLFRSGPVPAHPPSNPPATAERRPRCVRPLANASAAQFDEMVGQRRLLAPGSALRQSIEAGRVHSMVLWGPPGCGKTTLALLLAKYADAHFRAISAVLSGLPEVRQVLAEAGHRFAEGRRTVLFVDEVHRFNKAQQTRSCRTSSAAPSGSSEPHRKPSSRNSALPSHCPRHVMVPYGRRHLIPLHHALEDAESGRGGSGGGRRRKLRLMRSLTTATAPRLTCSKSPQNGGRVGRSRRQSRTGSPTAPAAATRAASVYNRSRPAQIVPVPIPMRRCTGWHGCSTAAAIRYTSRGD